MPNQGFECDAASRCGQPREWQAGAPVPMARYVLAFPTVKVQVQARQMASVTAQLVTWGEVSECPLAR